VDNRRSLFAIGSLEWVGDARDDLAIDAAGGRNV
jgi:hypothetical protein